MTSGAVTLPDATPTTVDTISVTVPAAGLALVVLTSSYNLTGATGSGVGGSPGVNDTLTFAISMSGTGGAGTAIAGASAVLTTDGTTSTLASAFLVPLASGANTITISVTGTRSGLTGGTATAVSGVRSAVIGAF